MKDLLPDACKHHTHNFIEVYVKKTKLFIDRVKWCKDCGAISVSTETISRKEIHYQLDDLISIFKQISLIKVKNDEPSKT